MRKDNGETGRATTIAAIYIFVLLLLFVLGVIENRIDSEGMGFLPLLVATTPWSWLLMGSWDSSIWGSGPHAKHVAIFVTCNIISGVANGFILYLFVSWRKKRASR